MSEQPITKRCTAEERKAFTVPAWSRGFHRDEPALGTLDERLGILVRRLGGNTRVPKPLKWERDMFPVTRIDLTEPDSDDLAYARDDLGADASDDEVYEVAAARAAVRDSQSSVAS